MTVRGPCSYSINATEALSLFNSHWLWPPVTLSVVCLSGQRPCLLQADRQKFTEQQEEIMHCFYLLIHWSWAGGVQKSSQWHWEPSSVITDNLITDSNICLWRLCLSESARGEKKKGSRVTYMSQSSPASSQLIKRRCIDDIKCQLCFQTRFALGLPFRLGVFN